MLGPAKATRPAPRSEILPPVRPGHRGGWAAVAALTFILIATAAWPATALTGDAEAARDRDPAAASVAHALAQVGEWLLDLAGLGDREAPPAQGGGDGFASAHSPMGPLIDPDGYTPRDPSPGGKAHDR